MRDETLLDVCLEEILSGQSPPDLSAQILAALRQQPAVAYDGAPRLPIEPPLAEPPVVSAPPPAVAAGSHASGVRSATLLAPSPSAALSRRRARADERRQWYAYAAASALAMVGLGVGLVLLQSNQRDADQPAVTVSSQAPDSHRRTEAPQADHSASAERLAAPDPFMEALFGAEAIESKQDRGVPWDLPYAVDPQADDKVIQFVNARLARRWRSAGITPAPAADDDEWCRRVFLQALGRQPTSEELVDFATSDSPHKRTELVADLLGPSYRGEFARHWAGVWTNSLLAGAAAGESDDSAKRQIHLRGLREYLQDALANEKPHDQIAAEILTATGSGVPGTPDFNGAAGLLLWGSEEDKSDVAAAVTRVFLGHHGQCAQCHDAADKGGLTQEQFWQLASFLQQATTRHDENSEAVYLADADFVSPTGDVDEAEIFYIQPDGQRKLAYPVFIDGRQISPSGRLDEVNRREELARLVVASEEFSKATVNRLWRRLLGRGLVEAGGTGSGAEDTHPELLQRLAEQFAAHKFDQKRLIQWIVLSEANARGSDAGGTGPGEVYLGDALFSRFAGPASRPQPMYDSVAVAMSAVSRGGRPISADRSILFARKASSKEQEDGSIFVRSPGSAAGARGPLPASGFVQRMMGADLAFGEKVDHLFLHAVARRPTQAEAVAAQRTLSYHNGNVAAALDDIWWAIVNSAEYHDAL